MKKIDSLSILLACSFASIFFTENILAQRTLNISSLDISIPIQAEYSGALTSPFRPFDYLANTIIEANTGNASLLMSRIKDSITFSAFSAYDSLIVSFSLDSIHNQLHNVYYMHKDSLSLAASYVTRYETISFLFSTINYTLSEDTLNIEIAGMECEKVLLSVSYFYNADLYYHEIDSTIQFQKVINSDSSKFVVRMSFVFGNNSLVLQQTLPLNFSVFTLLNKFNIYFSFLSSDRPQSLFIYDLLGREAARIEIPAGTTEYTLPSSRLASGYYFARLGNMGGKFVVISSQ